MGLQLGKIVINCKSDGQERNVCIFSHSNMKIWLMMSVTVSTEDFQGKIVFNFKINDLGGCLL